MNDNATMMAHFIWGWIRSALESNIRHGTQLREAYRRIDERMRLLMRQGKIDDLFDAIVKHAAWLADTKQPYPGDETPAETNGQESAAVPTPDEFSGRV